MYINMDNYKIEDLKDTALVMFLKGHDAAAEDLDNAVSNYLDSCKLADGSIPTFEKLRKSILQDFMSYAKEYLKSCNDEFLVSMLDEQYVNQQPTGQAPGYVSESEHALVD